MSAGKSTRKSFTAADKLKFIKQLEEGRSQKDVAAEFGIKQSTLSSIFSKKDELKRKAHEQPSFLKKKKPRPCKSPQLEKAMALFVQEARSQNVPLSGPIIQEKARMFAAKLGIQNFEASNGWLSKFNARNDISYKTICGESAAVNVQVADDWKENVLPGLLEGYEPEDIFNADETGLFFKCLPGLTNLIHRFFWF
jgi:transposase-like protein